MFLLTVLLAATVFEHVSAEVIWDPNDPVWVPCDDQPCVPDADCTDHEESVDDQWATCQCIAGYAGNGFKFERREQTLPGAFTGEFGNGCTEIDECNTQADTFCAGSGGVCVNLDPKVDPNKGQLTCSCDSVEIFPLSLLAEGDLPPATILSSVDACGESDDSTLALIASDGSSVCIAFDKPIVSTLGFDPNDATPDFAGACERSSQIATIVSVGWRGAFVDEFDQLTAITNDLHGTTMKVCVFDDSRFKRGVRFALFKSLDKRTAISIVPDQTSQDTVNVDICGRETGSSGSTLFEGMQVVLGSRTAANAPIILIESSEEFDPNDPNQPNPNEPNVDPNNPNQRKRSVLSSSDSSSDSSSSSDVVPKATPAPVVVKTRTAIIRVSNGATLFDVADLRLHVTVGAKKGHKVDVFLGNAADFEGLAIFNEETNEYEFRIGRLNAGGSAELHVQVQSTGVAPVKVSTVFVSALSCQVGKTPCVDDVDPRTVVVADTEIVLNFVETA